MSIAKRLVLDLHKPIVLTFDAFGTLFTPQKPIERLYAETAGKHGLSGFTEEEIGTRFREGLLPVAYRVENKKHRNYGRKDGMEPSDWWANVIKSTFSPYTACNGMPKVFIADLWDLFRTGRGYRLYPDVLPFFNYLSRLRQQKEIARITTGVITNSDDRVPNIISSLGLYTRSKRYDRRRHHFANEDIDVDSDIDFITMSYDTGTQKPSRRIFKAAARLSGLGTLKETQCIHVGDGLVADYYGAVDAGWHGILLKRGGEEVPMDDLRLMTQEAMITGKGYIPTSTDVPCIRDLSELRELLSPSNMI
ncbi:MAG: hypothetical protein Q9217_002930 [Psora testacea]